ncbi:plasmid mobilization relaxosome protein MobC (plasmid) [Adhaeribacter swui]|uniref:Plasmid mobilization relaxosome protein MobC n=1 Tax=Adhaeribacter swui TaxID=2086471 RepID=A0A7G7G2F8_9BACT|nr:plasmid mobilization relaxosome protein MobC [Adhaeribacter swui]QNF31342.1 plasmid mobilization relaxosome protein MobC [Adhaeribacter swui]
MEEEIKTWSAKGGRPKKEAKERKDWRLNLCFTEDEYKALAAEMEQAGYQDKLGIYAKTKLLTKQGTVPHNPKVLFAALNKLSPELKKVGANINQIARYVNYLDKNNMVDPKFMIEYNEHFKRMAEVQHEYALAIKAYLRSITK